MNRKIRRAAAKGGPTVAPPVNEKFVQIFNGALAAYQAGRLPEAIASFQQAVQLNPSHPLTHSNLGVALDAAGKLVEATECYRRAIELDPDFAMAYNNLGVTLKGLERHDEALSALFKALELQPHYPEAYNNLGNTFTDLGRYVEAEQAIRKALEQRPSYVEAYSNLAMVLREQSRLEEAAATFRKALAWAPALPMANKNLGLTLLQMGKFEEGWRGYDWRWLADKREPRSYDKPLWDGSPLNGKTLLIYAEQGLGDAIQFARYIPVIAATGAKVILEVHPQMVTLMRTVPGLAEVYPLKPVPLPEFDTFIAMMSLGTVMKTDETNVPTPIPYLQADPERVAKWRERIGTHGLKIGIVWQGNVDSASLRTRSANLAQFAPLAAIPGVRLISLQKQPTDRAPDPDIARLGVETLGPDFDAGPDAFLDTAAVMQNLELVVTIDTSIAHLAGALGRPVWIALRKVPDWRWLTEGYGSPWYPSARLFRQKEPNNWDDVFAEIAATLRYLMQR